MHTTKYILLFLLVQISLCAQMDKVQFRLMDEVTNSPIENVHVFFSNTTIGTISDVEGNVQLSIPPGLEEPLIISHIAYDSKVIENKGNQNLINLTEVFLAPNGINIDEIVVTQKRSKTWKKNFKRFKKAFLGESKAASKCKILNPEVLRFANEGGKFKVKAVDLIKVQNKYLGYDIEFLLEGLIIESNGSTSYIGYAKFNDSSTEKSKKKILKNRTKAYENSLHHFVQHLIHNKLNEGKYGLKIVSYHAGVFKDKMTPAVDDILYFDSTSHHFLLSFDDFLQITHLGIKEITELNSGLSQGGLESTRFSTRSDGPRSKIVNPQSMIYKITPLLIINKQGHITNQLAMQEYGYWANLRMADKLPIDYTISYPYFNSIQATEEKAEPIPKEKEAYPQQQTSLSIIRSLLYDDAINKNTTLKYLNQHWQKSYAPPLLDFLRFNRNAQLHKQITTLLKDKIGVQDYYEGLQWMWKNQSVYDSLYANIKGEIYQHLDPKFKTYFQDRGPSAQIALDEIVWGGVKQDGIPPLRNPNMIETEDASYLADDDIVFGISIDGDHRAYPKRILAWHEFFTDKIGGRKVAGVYCTLCGTMIAYDMIQNETYHDLGTSGFLYRSNKLMYDKKTQSLWSTINGEPVMGPLANQGIKLNTYSVVTTTWGEWKKRHPDTKVLSLETGHIRNYKEGEAYKSYFADDQLMFPVPKMDTRLKNKDEVLIIRSTHYTEDPLAISTRFLAKNRMYTDQIAGKSIVVLTDAGGSSRAYEASDIKFKSYRTDVLLDAKKNKWEVTESHLIGPNRKKLNRLPSHNSFWFAWFNVYPNTRLVR